MSKIKMIRPSADAIVVMIRRELMKNTGTYDTVNSNTSRMDDTSEHVPEYKSY